MLSRKQIMEVFHCSSDDAASFLNVANEIGVLHLSPMEALDAVRRHTLREMAVELFAQAEYNPDMPIKDLN